MKYLFQPTLTVLFLTLGLMACGDEPVTREATPAVPVTLAKASSMDWPNAYRYPGTVQGAQKVQLSTKMLGRISYLPVEEGTRVRQGQVLARIQSTNVKAQQMQVEANLQEAEAARTSAQTNFDRMQALYETESATKKELEDATTHLEVSNARLAALQGKLAEIDDALGYASITSPIDGYVVQKHAEQGDMATPGMPLLVIENTANLEVIAQVPETEISQIAKGDTVGIEVDALADATCRGVVTQVNPAGHAASRQFKVQVKVLPQKNYATLRSGMYARVVVTTGQQPLITVPESILITRGQLTGLYTVGGQDQALLRWVRTGKRYGDQIEILSGLAEGESYIQSAEGRLVDGQAIQVSN